MTQAPGQLIPCFIPDAYRVSGFKLTGNSGNAGRQDTAASRTADGFRAAGVNQKGTFNAGAESQPAFAELQPVFPGNK